ncbi:cyclin-P3-1-like [Phalaenopsis equestris]|uniref:cyclin-P3-1-like n=1 Tax=Phalaenopsis equestris TaxID=78828 RepID=UPI0009E28816|nr:cyclin-P3-1-like [Phalaenopsis equestris]XP_020580629.1 cyclin-P3-1-like [Phalaenopsis equestris]XP_020580630.1 cyclin-P3-1-like [Phalaenopsis equestris]XP_020580631.1 cyclin-P3-1-like [Phalaenopsis equestris]
MGSLQHETEDMHPELFLSLGLAEPGKKVVEFPCVLALFSSALERIIHKNEEIFGSMKTKDILTMFHGLRAPNIGIKDYIERIFKYSKCSPSCFVIAYIYIDRFLLRTGTYLTPLNVHRMLITGIAVAAKFIDDAFYNNAYYARVGGITTTEMNRLELNFLFSLDFKLHVSVENFRKYCVQLEMDARSYQIEKPLCKRKEWTNIEDSNCQISLQRCS